ncbi:penicillin-binding protein 1A [Rhizosphaericola mali]|uniref:penicillin-binding protein 1A n=1 Tax=Rhizosphaericola mali TaxID=2545455 RepID=UPI001CDA3282|nr:transglycosylase domain-containing protein [Rhizosphaericola mali]
MNKPVNKGTSKIKRSVKILWTVFFAGVGVVIVLILFANFGLLGSMPSIEELQNPSASQASQVFADDGSIMGKYYLEDRVNVNYKDISPYVVQALVATEDERFYEHSGVDAKSLLRAVSSFGGEGGASTITMQTAKNLFTENWGTKNVFLRMLQKLKECVIAVKLERNFTKEEILTLYLNTVAFGDNVYGIRNAARTFFQKDPDRLSVAESAVLIGMLKASTAYNPRLYPQRALVRRNTVINQMVRNHFLSDADADEIKATSIQLNYAKLDETTGLAPYFRMVLGEELKNWCKTHQKSDGSNYNLYKDGLKIYTTINPRMQLYAEDAVNQQLSYMQKKLNSQDNIRNGKVWNGFQNVLEAAMKSSDRWRHMEDEGASEADIRRSFKEKTQMTIFAWNKDRSTDTVMTPLDSIKYCRQMLQAGFMAMDPISGEVKAWVGGIDFKTFKYDHVNINTKRQVGSTMKPLLYSMAIENGGFTPNTPVEDVQQDFPGFGLVPNTTRTCSGETMPMSEALARSKNCATAYIMKKMGDGNVGATKFVDFLKLCGIRSNVPAVPSISLGSAEISLYEMLTAYSIFPGHGFNVKPMYVTRIEDRNGNTLLNNTPQRRQVISDITAYNMQTMMQGVMKYGTGRRMWSYDVDGEIAGKTGTTNDNSDAWFIGYTPQLLCGAWVGCDDRFIRFDNTADGGGSSLALPIWGKFYNKVEHDKRLGIDDRATFVRPDALQNDVIFNWINDNSSDGDDETNADSTEVTPDNANIQPESNTDGLDDEDRTPSGSPAKPVNKPVQAPKAILPKKDSSSRKN